MFDVISLEKTRFNESIRHNEGGSTFVGYLYAELNVKDALDNGEDLKIGMPDLQVRITAAGHPRIEFPKDLKEINGDERWVARYFSASKATREAITTLAFALPAVGAAVERALEERAAA